MTDVINGRMFFIAILSVLVPRHLDARLYSLSRMITTCVRIKYAIPSHPVMVSASTMVQKPAFNNMIITEINKIYGMFARILYISCIKTSTFFENPQIDPTITPTVRLIAAQIKAREMEILDPNHTASNVDYPAAPVPKIQ